MSLIQNYASVILDSLEIIKEYKKEDRELRLAIVSSGNAINLGDLFEEFREVVTNDDDEIAEGTDLEGNPIEVKWDYSNVKLDKTPEEIENEIAEMLAAASSGTASFAEATYGDWV